MRAADEVNSVWVQGSGYSEMGKGGEEREVKRGEN